MISLLLITSAISYSSEKCQEINLYSNNKTLFEDPVQNQTFLAGTCYAHTAAQMLDHHRRNLTSETAHYYHPIALALVSKESRGIRHYMPNMVHFNLMRWSFADLDKKGEICSYEYVAQRFKELKKGNQLSDDDLLVFIDSIWRNMSIARSNIFRTKEQAYEMAYNRTLKQKEFKGKIKFNLKGVLKPMISYHAMTRFAASFKFLREFVLKGCPERDSLRIPNYQAKFIQEGDFKYFQTQITQSLLKNNLPGVGYQNNVWAAPVGKLKLSPRGIRRIVSGFDGVLHYSVIVAQKKINGQCHYLIRNSFGEKYSSAHRPNYVQYLDDKTVDQTVTITKEKPLKRPYRVLGTWIEANDLFDNTYDLNTFRE